MKKIFYWKITGLITIFFAFSLSSCKKHTNAENLVTPPEQAHFMGKSYSKLFAITSDDSSWVKVGLTQSASYDRTVTIKVTSKTGVEGTNFVVSKKVLTFPAGKVIDSFSVKPTDVTRYATGFKDTVTFTIVLPGEAPSTYNYTHDVIIGPCFASDIAISQFDALLGSYPNSQDDPFGSPYHYAVPMSIKSWTETGPTTARVVINNLWDDTPSWGDLVFTVDATDPNDVHVLPVSTVMTNVKASTVFGATYANCNLVIRAHSNGAYGTLTWCSQDWVLEYQLGIYNPTSATIGVVAPGGLAYSGTQFTSSLSRQ